MAIRTPFAGVLVGVTAIATATMNVALDIGDLNSIPVIKKGTESVKKATEAAVAPVVEGVKVLTGQESLEQAGKNIVGAQGAALKADAETASAANNAELNVEIKIAEAVAGDPGKTVVTIATGPDRIQKEVATTAAMQAGEIAQGANPNIVLAEPSAAAIRAANEQYKGSAKPLPASVRSALEPFFSVATLDRARFTVGSLSISLPDLINAEQKTFAGYDNAVTVDDIIVFSKDPAENFHWWAYEVQHVAQYADCQVDQFAVKYLTDCHGVETQAEGKAQASFPLQTPISPPC